MAMPNLTDGIFGVGILFLTGTDAFLTESTIFEILSKFGVVAVLWYWLRDLKAQLKEQLDRDWETGCRHQRFHLLS